MGAATIQERPLMARVQYIKLIQLALKGLELSFQGLTLLIIYFR